MQTLPFSGIPHIVKVVTPWVEHVPDGFDSSLIPKVYIAAAKLVEDRRICCASKSVIDETRDETCPLVLVFGLCGGVGAVLQKQDDDGVGGGV